MASIIIPPAPGGPFPLENLNPPRPGEAGRAIQGIPLRPSLGNPAGVVVDLSIDPPDGDDAAGAVEKHKDEARTFAGDLDRGARQIAKAIEKFLSQIEHLQDQAEHVGEKFFRNLTRDLAEGNFDDRTPEKAASKLLSRFEHFGDKIAGFGENFTDRLGDILEKSPLAEEGQNVSAAFFVSQSVSLSIESLELTLQDGDNTLQVSYQKISLSVTTTVGMAISRFTPQALDLGGNLIDTALIDTPVAGDGLYVDAGAPDSRGLLDRLRLGAGEPGFSDPAQSALDSLLLFKQISTNASLNITRILLEAATRVSTAEDDHPAAEHDRAGFFDLKV